MKLKTTLTAGAAALALMTGAAMAETIKVGIAAEPYPPFAAPDSAGNWSGWEVEIANAICEVQELDCAITPVAWDGIIPSLMGEQMQASTARF